MLAFYLNLAQEPEEREWIEEVYCRYKKLIKYLAMLRTKNEEKAEDVTHNVMLRVIGHRKQLKRCDEEELRRFLYIVTRNEAINFMKKEQRFSASNVDDLALRAGGGDPQEVVYRNEILRCIAEMPPIYREALELSIYFNLSVNEIAGVLKISAHAARKRLERARGMVKDAIKEENYAECE